MRYFCLFCVFFLTTATFARDSNPFFSQAKNMLDQVITEENGNENSPLKNLYSLQVHHAKATDLVEKLKDLLPANMLSADERSNQLMLQGHLEDFKKVQKLVQNLDKALPQIVIEARIVTMNDLSLQEMGVRWGLFDKSPAMKPNSLSPSHGFNGMLESNFPNMLANNLNVNLGTANPAGAMTLQLATINGRLLDLELSALEKENSVEIIASPKLMTTNKRQAKIEQGTELPYVVTGKNDTQEVQFKDAVLSLEVTPQIAKNNKILMDLKITQNTPGEQAKIGKNEFVAIEKQEIDTQVLAHNGETIVLGGIFHDTVTNYVQKVPFLGDVPLIKYLFRKEGERHQKRELIIFVTPRIIYPQENNLLGRPENQRAQDLFHRHLTPSQKK